MPTLLHNPHKEILTLCTQGDELAENDNLSAALESLGMIFISYYQKENRYLRYGRYDNHLYFLSFECSAAIPITIGTRNLIPPKEKDTSAPCFPEAAQRQIDQYDSRN